MPELKDAMLITTAALQIFFAGCRNNDFRECRSTLDALHPEIAKAEQAAARDKSIQVILLDFRNWVRPPTGEEMSCIREGVEAETPYHVSRKGSMYYIMVP
ncbi:hypothetical protein HY637_04980 [Candidatus Woesearchaeota archaeon]|nr:hypothetical protein [Candidatus Woesearchaeota archaeon]